MRGTISDMPADSNSIEAEVATVEVDALEKEIEVAEANGEDELALAAISQRDAKFPRPWRQPIKFVLHSVYYAFAFLSLILFLAVLAAIPLVNFYVLGYFLSVESQVAKTGRLRNGFSLLHAAPKLVTTAAGIWLFLLPLRFLAGFAADAHIIEPGSDADIGLNLALNVAWVIVSLHLILAIARGGTFWCFVRPFKNFFWLISRLRKGNYFAEADEKIQAFVKEFAIGKHFWIGFRGFAVAFLWLFLPTVLYTIAEEPEGGQILLTVIGGIALAVVLSWIPFLQARFATENKFAAGFEIREIRSLYSYAPIAWSFTVVLVYLLALPLYLFKAFLLPQDAMWPITFIFVLSIYPTRIITGWAYQRAVRKRTDKKRSHWVVRWLAGGTLLPLLGIYVFILFFTQFLGEQGKAVLFQHHSLMLPSPF